MNLSSNTLRLRLALLALAAVSLLAVALFYAHRSANSGSPSSVAKSPFPSSPLPSLSTPEPGEIPDPTQPNWFLKWDHQDALRERRDIVVNGFSVGPNVEPQQGISCDDAKPPSYLDFSLAQSSRVAVLPAYLPFDLSVNNGTAVSCGGEVVLADVLLELPQFASDADLIARVRAGEDYFALPRGGSLEILRVLADPAWSSSIPPERWMPGTVAGYPAAIGRPIINAGYGDSEVLVYSDGVLTIVRGNNLSLDDMLRVAAGLFP